MGYREKVGIFVFWLGLHPVHMENVRLLFRLRLCWLLAVSLVLGLSLSVGAQQITVKGKVSILNSGYHHHGQIEYVQNARITAANAMPVVSDAAGNFTLTFVGQPSGSTVVVTVAKHGYEIANARDLQAVVIGAIAPLRIYMADSGSLAQEQSLLYGINLKVLTAEKDHLIQRLRGDSATSRATLVELQERFGREFEHRWAAEEYLNTQLEEAKERLPERAAEMARVNLDFASERYRRAYKLFREGKLDLALGLLDSLDMEAREAEGRMDSLSGDALLYAEAGEAVELSARQVVDCYRLKAEAYNLRFEYRKAAAVLEKGLALLLRVKRGVEDLEVGEIYENQATFLERIGEYSWQKSILLRSLEIKRNSFPLRSPYLIGTLRRLGNAYMHVRQFDSARIVIEDGITIQLEQDTVYPTILAASIHDVAFAYEGLGRIDLAFLFLNRAIEMQESNGANIKIHTYYHNLATLEFEAGDFENALRHEQESISILEKYSMVNLFELSKLYDALSTIYLEMNDPSSAFEAQEKSLKMKYDVVEPNNPTISIGLVHLSRIYKVKGELVLAKEALFRALALYKSMHDTLAPVIAGIYNDLAVICIEENSLAEALQFQKTAIGSLESSPISSKDELAIGLHNLAVIHLKMGLLDSALMCEMRALALRREFFFKNNLGIASSLANLSDIYDALEDIPNAIVYLKECIETQKSAFFRDTKSMSKSYIDLSRLLKKANQLEEAIGAGKEALSMALESEKVDTLALATIYSEVGDLFKLSMVSDSSARYYKASLELLELKLKTKDSRVLDAKIKLNDDLVDQGIKFLQEKKFETALLFFHQSNLLLPKYPTSWFLKGFCYYELRNYKEAVLEFEVYDKLNTEANPVSLFYSGLSHLNIGELSKAQAQFQKLQEMLPDSPIPYRAWATYFAVKNDSEKSLQNLEKAIQIGYDDWNWIKTEECLKSIRNHPRYLALIQKAPK